MLTAWNRQLKLDSIDDPRVAGVHRHLSVGRHRARAGRLLLRRGGLTPASSAASADGPGLGVEEALGEVDAHRVTTWCWS